MPPIGQSPIIVIDIIIIKSIEFGIVNFGHRSDMFWGCGRCSEQEKWLIAVRILRWFHEKNPQINYYYLPVELKNGDIDVGLKGGIYRKFGNKRISFKKSF